MYHQLNMSVNFYSYGGVTRQDILADRAYRAIKELKQKFSIFIELSGAGKKGAIEVMKRWSPELRKLGVNVGWSSHVVTGTDDPSAHKGGVDVIETSVKRVVEWSGYTYRRKTTRLLPAKPEWEETKEFNKGVHAIIATEKTVALVQSITGSEGVFRTKRKLEYGTKIAAGSTPRAREDGSFTGFL